jgi:hypothetical protein
MHTLFYGHRSMHAALCFMDRRSCFYSKEQWMGFALTNTYQHATSYFQMLLFVAYLTPHLMEEYDSTILTSVDRLYQMLLYLRQFVYQFNERKRSFECTAMVPLIVAKETYSDDLFRNGIHFATVGVATCLLYLLGFQDSPNQSSLMLRKTWHFRASQSPSRCQQRQTKLLHMRRGFADHCHTVSMRKRG